MFLLGFMIGGVLGVIFMGLVAGGNKNG